MNARTPTHYEVLGLTPAAGTEQIKRRYRELARRYHPDVSKTANAAEKFKEINEAHRVLSDPERRATYDAELRLAARNQADVERKVRESDRTSASAPPPPGQRPAGARPAGTRSSGARPSSSPRPSSSGRRTTSERPADAWIAEAQRAFSRMMYREAEALCRQALRLDRRNAVAYEILGDILRARNRPDEAIAMYSYALQLDRSNRGVQAKFDRLVGVSSGPTMAGGAARSAQATTAAGAGLSRQLAPVRALMTGIGAAMGLFLLVVVLQIRDPPAPKPWIFTWDPLLVFAMAACGALLGFLFAVNGLTGYARDELTMRAAGRGRRMGLPVGGILFALSVVSFYAAAVLYLVIGFVQETMSKSLLRAFASSFVLVALFALAAYSNALNIFITGGNIVFLAYLTGWYLSDLFR